MWIQAPCTKKHIKGSSRNYLSLFPSVTSPLELQPQHLGGLKGSQAQLPHRELVGPGVPLSASVPRAFLLLPPGAAASLQPRPWRAAEAAVSRAAVPAQGPVGSRGWAAGHFSPAGQDTSAGERDVQGEEQGSVSVPAGCNPEEAAAAGTGSGQAPLSPAQGCCAVLAWAEGLALSGQRQPVLGISWSRDREFCAVTELHFPAMGSSSPGAAVEADLPLCPSAAAGPFRGAEQWGECPQCWHTPGLALPWGSPRTGCWAALGWAGPG